MPCPGCHHGSDLEVYLLGVRGPVISAESDFAHVLTDVPSGPWSRGCDFFIESRHPWILLLPFLLFFTGRVDWKKKKHLKVESYILFC